MTKAGMDKERLKAEILFSEMWNSFNTSWSHIFSFQSLASTTIPTGADYQRRELRAFIDDMKPGRPYSSILKDATGFFARGEDVAFVDKGVKNKLDSALAAVDAACLVFGHSVLDDLLNSCLKVIYEVGHNEYEQKVLETKVTIKDLINGDADSLIRQKTENKRRDLERNSMVVKSDFIHSVCKTVEKGYTGNGYCFDRQRIAEIDQLRQDVVHGPATDLGMDIGAALKYLHLSCMYFWYMLHQKYDLKLFPDQQHIEQFKQLLDSP